MRIGIIGLPQAGATTVFNALTGAHGDTSAGHRAGESRVGVLRVPDERLEFLSDLFEPRKTTFATLEADDCGGAFAHIGTAGAAANAQAMGEVRTQDALLIVLRAFRDPTVPHVLGSVEPRRDLARVEEELLLADLAVVETRIGHIDQSLKRPLPGGEKEELHHELDLLGRCREAIEEQRGIRSVELSAEQEKMLRSYSFLTLKPAILLLNVGEEEIGRMAAEIADLGKSIPALTMCARLEMEIMELDEGDRAEFMADAGLDEPAAGHLVRQCYRLMGLRTFFTHSEEECRAWTLHAGQTALDAAAVVHTDFSQKFIRAEVVAFEDLKEHGGIREVKAAGKFRLEGRDYQVQDGDVIFIRHG